MPLFSFGSWKFGFFIFLQKKYCGEFEFCSKTINGGNVRNGRWLFFGLYESGI